MNDKELIIRVAFLLLGGVGLWLLAKTKEPQSLAMGERRGCLRSTNSDHSAGAAPCPRLLEVQVFQMRNSRFQRAGSFQSVSCVHDERHRNNRTVTASRR
jgi:hypothetical protein